MSAEAERLQRRLELERAKLAKPTTTSPGEAVFAGMFAGLSVVPPEQAAERAEQRRDAERESERAGRRLALESSGVLHHITDADAAGVIDGTLEATAMLGYVQKWMDGDRPAVLLMGSVGRGKTVAAAWVLAFTGGQFVTAHAVLRAFAGRYGKDIKAQTERLLSTRLLVVDDIGREHKDDRAFMEAALTEILDARRSLQRRTILTSNLSLESFRKRYQCERLQSRLYQSAVFHQDAGEDMRRRR